MKYFRIILCMGMLAYAGFLFTLREPQVQWQGQASSAMNSFYRVKKAEAVNSSKITVLVDDTEILSDSSRELLYMSGDLELMASPEALAKIFHGTVEALEGDVYQISHGDRVCTFWKDSDEVRDPDGTFCFPDAVLKKNGDVYISVYAVCLALSYGYSFDDETGVAAVVCTDSGQRRLPESYDMRSDGRAPEVGSQGNLGTCWAFAAVAALESSLLPEEPLRFSVDHLSMNHGFKMDQNAGGDYFMALSYLASWKGPVYAGDDPYGDNRTDTSLAAVKHLQEALKITAKDYETIKRMVYEKGAVQSSFYSDIEIGNASSDYYNMDTAAYYYDGTAEANHDIVIVGWDDHYPKENFNHRPAQDGAFLCQNSWGRQFGREGYFYISYEDTNIGVYNIVYTSLAPADNYDHIYQSDSLGWLGSIGYNMPSAWLANVYTAPEPQTLKALSFYATAPGTVYKACAVPVYADESDFDNAIFLKSGYIEQAGYYTVALEQDIQVSEKFAIMLYIETEDAVHPVAIEYAGGQLLADVDLTDGQGYISPDRAQWQRVEENYQCNICLKAFTNDIN